MHNYDNIIIIFAYKMKYLFYYIIVYMAETAVLYAYHQTPNTYKILKYFLKYGLPAKNTHYYFLVNISHRYLKKIRVRNPNVFTRTYPEAINAWNKWYKITNELKDKYKYYIFIKDKSVGPFVPEGCQTSDWVKLMTSTIDDTYKFSASCINPLIKRRTKQNRPHLMVNF